MYTLFCRIKTRAQVDADRIMSSLKIIAMLIYRKAALDHVGLNFILCVEPSRGDATVKPSANEELLLTQFVGE